SVLFDGTPTPVLYSLSLHDALPISLVTLEHPRGGALPAVGGGGRADLRQHRVADPRLRRNTLDGEDLGESRGTGYAHLVVLRVIDRKSTRLNSSHVEISYAVFCLKK